MSRRAVFLDRDGVLNKALVRDGKPYPPRRVEEFELIDGVPEALAALKAAGFLLIVVTNQPDVPSGLMARADLDAIHDRLRAALPIDDIRVCLCGKDAGCRCYKPAPGMLLDAARDWKIDISASFMIGDRWRDVGAGRAAGCRTVFIEAGYSERTPDSPDWTVSSLIEAATILIQDTSEMTSLGALRIKIYADGADLAGIAAMAEKPYVKGFTTNPTLMHKAGVTDYKAFAIEALKIIGDRPLSLEVFADDFPTMERQALEIATWNKNVYVKIPIMNTQGESAVPLIGRLAAAGVRLNVTAIMTLGQVAAVAAALDPNVPAVVSVFAGRIADTGRDPVPMMRAAKALLAERPQAELLWASPRELLNIFHADEVGCEIITVTNDVLGKLPGLDKDLNQFSRETVQMFYRDAQAAGFTIDLPART